MSKTSLHPIDREALDALKACGLLWPSAEAPSEPQAQSARCALASGSACLVCGSTLTLQIRRGPDGVLDLLHCNHCGSEVPRHIRLRVVPKCDALRGLLAECSLALDTELLSAWCSDLGDRVAAELRPPNAEMRHAPRAEDKL